MAKPVGWVLALLYLGLLLYPLVISPPLLPGPGPTPLDLLLSQGGATLLLLALSLPAAVARFRQRTWKPFPRMTEKEAEQFYRLHMGMAMVLALLALLTPGFADLLRLRTAVPAPLSFLLGFAAYLPIHHASLHLRPRKVGRLVASREFLRGMRRLIARTPGARRHILLSLLVNPFTEEFAYRGILVLVLSRFTGVPLALLLGLAICLAAHLYQGPSHLSFHGLFYFLSVALLFSEGGLWAAFGFHFAGDLLPWLRVPREVRILRTERAARAAQSPGPRIPRRRSGQ
ncbi:MAG: CPBP family intramembrane metalloprotease [Planctomycetes bacterium]|nr:CPBP family intramembrane metalloprotease [Planctomycetota bacterium]